MELILTSSSSAFSTPQSIDSLIVNYFNNLGWWGNLILFACSLLLATILGGLEKAELEEVNINSIL